MKQYSTYHKVLRVSALVFAFVLVFESGLLSASTVRISQNTHHYLANAVGASASVQPTELNKFTAALTQKKQELDAREASLNEREISVSLTSGKDSYNNDTATYVLASILFILLVLILLNYTLDYLRIKESKEGVPV